MKSVLHIGAAAGELCFYSGLGVDKLVYAEPDKVCLSALSANIRTLADNGSPMEILVIPKACSHSSGQTISFNANGMGQSSIEEPRSRTFEMVGNNFSKYTVETITLRDLKDSTFGHHKVDYLCIDTQGHEMSIICSTDPEYLRRSFWVIDVELMTDTQQYTVSTNAWRQVVSHLIRAGFEPLIHPHGITESYIFINSLINPSYYTSSIEWIRDRVMSQYFAESDFASSGNSPRVISALGDHMFLPLTHVGGSIHASRLQQFREGVVSFLLTNLDLLRRQEC